MPIDYSRYPANWAEISRRIRFERAQGRCEQCGVEHGAYILRSTVDPARYLRYDVESDRYYFPDGSLLRVHLSEFPEEYDRDKFTRVVLTVHHIGIDKPDGSPGDIHDKTDCRDENLLALCQRCHLIADMPTHVQNARATRLHKKAAAIEAAGQRKLL